MDELSTYPYLFDRRRSSHDWLESLGELGRGNEPENAALAQNWRMDRLGHQSGPHSSQWNGERRSELMDAWRGSVKKPRRGV